jgi:uroporphyrinogen decarboxylase
MGMREKTYTSRERVIEAINHREPDRIPYTLASSLEDAITHQAYEGWIKLLGLKEEPDNTLYNILLDLVGFKQIPGNILRELRVDTRGFLLQQPSEPKSDIAFEGTTMVFVDDWQIKYGKPETSLYIDPLDFPLKGDLTDERLDNFPYPDGRQEGRFQGIAEEARRCRETGCAVIMSAYGLGQWDYTHLLAGMEASLMNLVIFPKQMDRLLHKINDVEMEYWEKGLEVVGHNIDIAMHSDDLGMQNNLQISPEMYRKFLKPLHKELFDLIKKKSPVGTKILLHSCGAIRPLIPDLIEVGVDILNPIQVRAAGMDTYELKRDFGKDIVFWGGGCDTQEILPRGTPQEVRDEVKRRIDDLAPGGGFVFCPVHNIQADVPPENLQAMWETLQEYGKY